MRVIVALTSQILKIIQFSFYCSLIQGRVPSAYHVVKTSDCSYGVEVTGIPSLLRREQGPEKARNVHKVTQLSEVPLQVHLEVGPQSSNVPSPAAYGDITLYQQRTA